MNKYVDHLTIDEYKTIREQLKLRLDDLKKSINSEIGKRKYIETRFIIIKIDQIIKKYEKKSWHTTEKWYNKDNERSGKNGI